MTPKLRVSYSILKLWQQGRVDDMIVSYFKLGQMYSKAMDEGKQWDEYNNLYVSKHKQLAPEFGGDKLINPTPQVKWVTPYDETCDLVTVIDVLDAPTLYEVKTGVSKDSGDYCNDFQVAMYLLAAHMQGVDIERAYIIHYNQVTRQTDRSLIWNLSYERKRAKNYIDTLAPEVYNYFVQNDLFNKHVS